MSGGALGAGITLAVLALVVLLIVLASIYLPAPPPQPSAAVQRLDALERELQEWSAARFAQLDRMQAEVRAISGELDRIDARNRPA